MPISQGSSEAQEQLNTVAIGASRPMEPSENDLFGDFDSISEEDDGSK